MPQLEQLPEKAVLGPTPEPPKLTPNVKPGDLVRVPGQLLDYLKDRYGMAPSTYVTCREREHFDDVSIDPELAKYGIIEYLPPKYHGYVFISGSNQYHKSQLTAFRVSRQEILANSGDPIKIKSSAKPKKQAKSEPKLTADVLKAFGF
jgi:hypothetical protein